jgi:hypothetical protein
MQDHVFGDHLGLAHDHLGLLDRGDVDQPALVDGRARALALASSIAARISRASVTAASDGVKTSLASATCLGWIAHLPTMPSVADRAPARGSPRRRRNRRTGRPPAARHGSGRRTRWRPAPSARGRNSACALVQHVVVFLRPADPGGLHAHRRREIGGAEAHGLHARAGGGDLLDMGDAGGAFDDDLEADLLLPPHRRLDRRHQRVDGVDVGGSPTFGIMMMVEPLAGLFQQVDHVAVPIGAVEPVDPHAQRLVAPVDAPIASTILARACVLVIGGDGILEVEVDHIRGGSSPSSRRSRGASRGRTAGSDWDGRRVAAECGSSWAGLAK